MEATAINLHTRRAEIFAEIAARVTIDALPAPKSVRAYESNTLAVSFDTYDDAQRWVSHLGLQHNTQVYVPDWEGWDGREVRALSGWGDWQGWSVQVSGWSAIEAAVTS